MEALTKKQIGLSIWKSFVLFFSKCTYIRCNLWNLRLVVKFPKNQHTARKLLYFKNRHTYVHIIANITSDLHSILAFFSNNNHIPLHCFSSLKAMLLMRRSKHFWVIYKCIHLDTVVKLKQFITTVMSLVS